MGPGDVSKEGSRAHPLGLLPTLGEGGFSLRSEMEAGSHGLKQWGLGPWVLPALQGGLGEDSGGWEPGAWVLSCVLGVGRRVYNHQLTATHFSG